MVKDSKPVSRILVEKGEAVDNQAALLLPVSYTHLFTHNGKPYFAIGFPNTAGGYEVRNPFFKGCVAPKDITHIRQQGVPRNMCYLFEGFMDYLSFLTIRMKNRCV